ncbi:MAG: hypothetical protein LBO64_01660 [Desulfovibrio sp.]|jgi:hypothetical protein|nr:hypothetical protein [Desulfovibrio sp.]
MMKLRLSATKLRLSKFFRYLAALCILKFCILGMLVLDLPLTGKKNDGDMTTRPVQTTVSHDARMDSPSAVRPRSDDLPQGTEAAKAAASMTPARQAKSTEIRSELPVPNASAGAPADAGQAANDTGGMPLLVAGESRRGRLDGWLDMLGLNHLPIPGFGGVQLACAAGLDMPVPQTPAGSSSPFTPAEQSAPITLPGAPDIPAGIPRGQAAGGAPLAPRPGAAPLPSLPQSGQTSSLPAPLVTPNNMPEDPNAQAQDLARQQQDILMLRQQMDQRLKDLQSAEEKMKDMLREAKGVEDKKVHSLIQMYSNMKPKVAAKALESLDERIAIRLLFGMPPKQSGEILTYTDPEKTAKFTELLTRMRLPE